MPGAQPTSSCLTSKPLRQRGREPRASRLQASSPGEAPALNLCRWWPTLTGCLGRCLAGAMGAIGRLHGRHADGAGPGATLLGLALPSRRRRVRDRRVQLQQPVQVRLEQELRHGPAGGRRQPGPWAGLQPAPTGPAGLPTTGTSKLLELLPTTGRPPLSPTAPRGTFHQPTRLPSARRGSFLSADNPSSRSSGLSPLRNILPSPRPLHHTTPLETAPESCLPGHPGPVVLSPPPRRRRSPAPPAPQHFKRRADGAPVGRFKPNGRALPGDGRATQRDWLSRGAGRSARAAGGGAGGGAMRAGAGRRRRDQAGA